MYSQSRKANRSSSFIAMMLERGIMLQGEQLLRKRGIVNLMPVLDYSLKETLLLFWSFVNISHGGLMTKLRYSQQSSWC